MLSNEDLQKIRNVIKSENELVIIRLEKFEARLSNLEFDNKKEHQEIIRLIESIKQMETENLQAFNNDLNQLEKRVAKLEAKMV